MPLEVEIIRDGEPVQLVWDGFALSAMYTAAFVEGDPRWEYQDGKSFGDLEPGKWVDFSNTPIYYLVSKCALVKKGVQKLRQDHTFGSGDRAIELKAGDELRAWRSHKR